MFKFLRLLGALTVAASMAACGDVAAPSNSAAEDFADTLQPSGQAFKTFSVEKTGEMLVTLQSLTPRPVVGFVSLAVGSPSGSLCAPYSSYYIAQAAVGQQYSFPRIVKGSYCLWVGDTQSILPQAATFAVHFTHP